MDNIDGIFGIGVFETSNVLRRETYAAAILCHGLDPIIDPTV